MCMRVGVCACVCQDGYVGVPFYSFNFHCSPAGLLVSLACKMMRKLIQHRSSQGKLPQMKAEMTVLLC